MSTIGLNEGPFLIMTVTYENSVFTIADLVENKVPTITLSPADSIYLAEGFSKLISTRGSSVVFGQQSELCPGSALEKFVPTVTERDGNIICPSDDDSGYTEAFFTLEEICLKAKVWGCEYLIFIRKTFDMVRERDVVHMEICNGNFDVKGYFTKDAEQFFQWALDDITHRNDHDTVDLD